MAINPVEIIIKAKDEASSIFSSMGSKVAAVGTAIAAYFGINAFVGAVKGAADLEAKLSEVQAVSGATTAEMVLLRKAAEDAGATTKYTATEAAEALGNLARAGLSAKDTIGALPAVLQLAQAGGVDLGQASEYITKTVTGMGLSFAEAGRVADVMALGANASNTSVRGVAEALSYAAPLANTLGLSLETTVAIIGKFADGAIDASRAGTALNAIMAQFADPASKFREELAGAGITTTNFEQALRQLAAAGPAGSKAINAVGTEAGPALRTLLNQGIGALDNLKDKLDNAKGSAAATAEVMAKNLNGSLGGLSSAWDTVKATLATPVLPVLKDGVDQLSKAFSDAVKSGVVKNFGESIAVAFQAGIKWAQGFVASIDVTKVAADLRAFAADATVVFDKIGNSASNAGNVAKTAYGVMSAGANAVMTAIYGLGVAIGGVVAGFQKALASLYDGMAKITFGDVANQYKKMAADIRQSADATQAANRAMADKVIQSFIDMSDRAQQARDGWDGIKAAATAASTQAVAATSTLRSTEGALSAVGTAAAAAAEKVKDGADKQQAAAKSSKDAVAALRAEYEAAVKSGNWQVAAEKMQALRDAANEAKTGVAGLKRQAEEDAAAVAASFERMGLKTKEQLNTIATVAKQDFDRINASGQATAEGLQSAFRKYAEAAIAANGGVASETLKAEAAMRGLQIATDSTGRAIVTSMGSASQAVRQVGEEAKKTIDELNGFDKAFKNFSKTTHDAGSGTSNAPIDKIQALREKVRRGQTGFTQDEYDEAKAQIDNLIEWFNSMDAAFVGSAAWSDAIDLKRALQSVHIIDKKDPVDTTGQPNTSNDRAWEKSNPAPAKPDNTTHDPIAPVTPSPITSAKSYDVNITLGGNQTTIHTSSDADAQALIAVLQRAKLTA